MTGAHRAGGAGAPVALEPRGLPQWLQPVARAVETLGPRQLSRFLPPAEGGRQSAVLVLFGEGERESGEESERTGGDGVAADSGSPANSSAPPASSSGASGLSGSSGPELLLLERASSLRSHAGQPSFPGGALDPEDGDPSAAEAPLRAALREAEEETGLDPAGVQLFAVLPRLYIPVSDFVVTPVLGWWHTRCPVTPVDPAETARVFSVPVTQLAAPENRATAVHPSGHHGPCFFVDNTLVWGFTAGVIDRILHYAGWEEPWDPERRVPLDWRS